MSHPPPAYVGTDSYTFVSYSHADEDIVFTEIRWLQGHGINVWYDTTGIGPGGEWNDEIAKAIKRADRFIYFVTPASVLSEHCRRELNFAQSENRRVVVVHLKETIMPDGMRLSLDNRQAILKYRLSSSEYRNALIRSLSPAGVAPVPGGQAKKVPGSWRHSLVLILIALFGASVWWLWQERAGSVAPEIVENREPSIAVLPFVNMSNDPDQQYFADGIAEEVLSLLARNPDLKVISRSSAFTFRGGDLEVPAIAAQLNVKHVLEGSVRKSGDYVRVTAHLIEAHSDSYLWSETFDRTLDDVFAVQSEIANRVAERLNVALLDLRPPRYGTSSDAYALYAQARYILGMDGTLDDTRRAKTLLDEALEIDSGYVPAWNELARAYSHLTLHGVLPNGEGHRLTYLALTEALSLDPDDAVANAWYGWNTSLWEGEFRKGVSYFKKGLSLDPTNLDVLRPAVPLLQVLGKPEDALALAEYVVERDPLCVICTSNLGRTYMMLDRFADAERVLQRGLSLSPDNRESALLLGENQLLQGDYAAALGWFDRLPSDWPTVVARKAIVFHDLGDTEGRNRALAVLETLLAYRPLAIYYAWTGDARKASEYLQQSITTEEEWHHFFETRHLWGVALGKDRQWQEFLKSVGLSSQQIDDLNFSVRVPG